MVCIAAVLIWFAWLTCACINSTGSKSYIVVHGEKYYKCGSRTVTDTIDNPGGIIITTTTSKYYDHFKCK